MTSTLSNIKWKKYKIRTLITLKIMMNYISIHTVDFYLLGLDVPLFHLMNLQDLFSLILPNMTYSKVPFLSILENISLI